jgi:hypothetical protein
MEQTADYGRTATEKAPVGRVSARPGTQQDHRDHQHPEDAR